MKTSQQQIFPSGGDVSTFSREDSPASRSALPDSDGERTMTAISGLRCCESSVKSGPLISLVKTLLESCRWYSPAARLRWSVKPLSSMRVTPIVSCASSTSSKRSAKTSKPRDIPSSRLLFRLVPSVRHTAETVCGSSPSGDFPHLLMTPTTREFNEAPESMRERQKRNGYKNGTRYNSLLSQVIYSDLLPTPVTQGLKVCEGKKMKFMPLGLLPTPLAVEVQHPRRIEMLKAKGGQTMGSRANGELRPNGIMDFLNFHGILPTPNAVEGTKWAATYNPNSQMGRSLSAMAVSGMLPTPWLITPGASDGMRSAMTMEHLKAHRKPRAEHSNLSEQIAHKVGGGNSQLSPLFVTEMMGYPLIYLVLPFLTRNTGEGENPTTSPDGEQSR